MSIALLSLFCDSFFRFENKQNPIKPTKKKKKINNFTDFSIIHIPIKSKQIPPTIAPIKIKSKPESYQKLFNVFSLLQTYTWIEFHTINRTFVVCINTMIIRTPRTYEQKKSIKIYFLYRTVFVRIACKTIVEWSALWF